MTSSWHRFAPMSDDDHDCRQPNCGLIVADDLLELGLVAVPCPAPSCTDSGNGGPCVMVLTADDDEVAFPVCAYCEGRGDLISNEDDQDPDEDDQDADLE